MLKKLVTFLILILTIFTNSWSFVFWENKYQTEAQIIYYDGLYQQNPFKNWRNNDEKLTDLDKINKKNNKPYNARVYAKDENWVEIQKKWYSTFFPDNWDRNKIMEEVEFAVKNNSWRDSSPWSSPNEYKWFSKNWTQINFYLRESDWAILSYFPKIISTND